MEPGVGHRGPPSAATATATAALMATNGSGKSLQDNSSELMQCLETLREERDALSRDLALDLEERNKIQLDVQVLVRRLNTVTESATRRARVRYAGPRHTPTRTTYRCPRRNEKRQTLRLRQRGTRARP